MDRRPPAGTEAAWAKAWMVALAFLVILVKISEQVDIIDYWLGFVSAVDNAYTVITYYLFLPLTILALFTSYWALKIGIRKLNDTQALNDLVPVQMFRDAVAEREQIRSLLSRETMTVSENQREMAALREQLEAARKETATNMNLIGRLRREKADQSSMRIKWEAECFSLRNRSPHTRNTRLTAVGDDNTPSKINRMAEENARLKGQVNALTIQKDSSQAENQRLEIEVADYRRRCDEIENQGFQKQVETLTKELKTCRTRCDGLEAAQAAGQNAEVVRVDGSVSPFSGLRDRVSTERIVKQAWQEAERALATKVTETVRAEAEASFEARFQERLRPYLEEGQQLLEQRATMYKEAHDLIAQHTIHEENLRQDLERALAQSAAGTGHADCKRELAAAEARLTNLAISAKAEGQDAVKKIEKQKAKEVKKLKADLELADNARITNHRNTVAHLQQIKDLTNELSLLRTQAGLSQSAHNKSFALEKELKEMSQRLAEAETNQKVRVVDEKSRCMHACPRHCKMGSRYTKEFDNIAKAYEELMDGDTAQALGAVESEMKEDGTWEDSDPESAAGQYRREVSLATTP